MKSLKQSIKEFLDSWVECSKCNHMFDTSKLIIYKKNNNHFCKDCI